MVNETKATDDSVEEFVGAIDHDRKREEARELLALFGRVTGEAPKMWGPSIIGFGSYHYTYDSGREGDWMRTGFSPRKARHSLYLMGGYCNAETGARRDVQLERLGKWKRGKSCLYINKLADVDMDVLEEIIADDWATMKDLYPPA
ncbi:DUF1801 domain-containing protein [Pseudoblastomonas halimionae]|uniref:DUF1801 domain-containing protein n=1 Tax=Alteriqipengyuania halimionae TaxID=1926630 RepID=A0A6I4U1N6_9SPHN|nr:DUF1801 domain-containing protein [Alteriqipengyuania halimionae]MXP09818.1 DUF1801 domain-containing protein [Alteriqipengyuania halimionae]